MLYKAGLQRLFLAQQPTLLSKSSHIPLLPVCLSPRRTKKRLGMSCCRWTSLWPDHTLMHTHRIHTDPSRENKSMLRDLFQQLSEWLTVSPSVLHIQQMALSVYLYSGTKGQLKCVCVRWLQHSTAFSTPFTHKSRVTDTPEQRNHTNMQKTQSCYTQRAWESFWPLPRVKGGV